MYAFIDGVVCDKSDGTLILLAGGVGYQISCSMTTLQAAPAIGQIMRCFTHFSVREDAVDLFGFATREEKELFLQLITVSGVGPKMALALLSTLQPHDLRVAILLDDIAAISRAPGIGKKTAQRIALDLKDRISQVSLGSSGMPAAASVPLQETSDAVSVAMEALMALGYTSVEARTALQKVRNQSEKTEELISLALRAMVSM